MSSDSGVNALYLHIPFCARKCAYCDFSSWATPAGDPLMAAHARALERQIGEVEAWLCACPGVLAEQVTGSGTCSFAVFESAAAANAAAAGAAARGWRSWSTKTLGSATEVC